MPWPDEGFLKGFEGISGREQRCEGPGGRFAMLVRD